MYSRAIGLCLAQRGAFLLARPASTINLEATRIFLRIAKLKNENAQKTTAQRSAIN